jgi:UDP-glucose 4-epimerase
MKICITGAEGFIGSHLQKFLTKKNFKLFLLDRKKIKDGSLIKDSFKKINLIIHCAGSGQIRYSNNNKKLHYQNNVVLSQRLVRCIRKSKNKKIHLIYLSSQAVYGNPQIIPIKESHETNPSTDYGKTKLQVEKLFKNCKILKKLTVLRLFSIYGNGLRKQVVWDSCEKLSKSRAIFKGSGYESRDFLNINDLSVLIYKIILTEKFYKSAVFNVGSGVGTKIKKLIILISKFLKKEKLIKFKRNTKSTHSNFVSENKKVFKFFNWKSKIKIEKGLKEYTAWYKKINLDYL